MQTQAPDLLKETEPPTSKPPPPTAAAQIIAHEFDVEIFIRSREAECIAAEISRARDNIALLQEVLRRAAHEATLQIPFPPQSSVTCADGTCFAFGRVEDAFGGRSPDLPTRSASVVLHPTAAAAAAASLKRPLKKAVARDLFERRADGVYVRLRCPECSKDKFINLLGFVNHCRIQHNLYFATPEDRIAKCGVPAEPDSLPDDVMASFRTNADAALNHSLAQLRVEQHKNTPENRPQIAVHHEEPLPDDACQPPQPFACEDAPDLDADADALGKATREVRLLTGTLQPPIAEAAYADAASDDDDETLRQIAKKLSQPPSEEAVRFFNNHSRFYVKKRIIVGNVVKTYFDAAINKHQFKWKLYFRSPDATFAGSVIDTVPVESFVKKIRVYLHDSYRPHNVVEIYEPPFVLGRSGWGEFTVKIQIFVHFNAMPVDVCYRLVLGPGRGSPKYVVGNEKVFEIEIDKNVASESHIQMLELDKSVPPKTLASTGGISPAEASSFAGIAPPPSTNSEEAAAGVSQPGSDCVPGEGAAAAPPPKSTLSKVSSKGKIKFCKFCGSAHSSKSFEQQQRTCSLRLEVDQANTCTPMFSLPAPTVSLPALSSACWAAKTASSSSSPLNHERLPLDALRRIFDARLGNDFVFLASRETCALRLPSYAEASSQPCAMHSLVLVGKATEIFCKRLLLKGLEVLHDNAHRSRRTDNETVSILTPVHLFSAISTATKSDSLTFLTNAYLLKPQSGVDSAN